MSGLSYAQILARGNGSGGESSGGGAAAEDGGALGTLPRNFGNSGRGSGSGSGQGKLSSHYFTTIVNVEIYSIHDL